MSSCDDNDQIQLKVFTDLFSTKSIVLTKFHLFNKFAFCIIFVNNNFDIDFIIKPTLKKSEDLPSLNQLDPAQNTFLVVFYFPKPSCPGLRVVPFRLNHKSFSYILCCLIVGGILFIGLRSCSQKVGHYFLGSGIYSKFDISSMNQ